MILVVYKSVRSAVWKTFYMYTITQEIMVSCHENYPAISIQQCIQKCVSALQLGMSEAEGICNIRYIMQQPRSTTVTATTKE